MTLHQLLQKISEGQAINFTQLLHKLPKNVDWQSCFSAELVTKNRYKVKVLNQGAFNELLQSSMPATSREAAANHLLQSTHDLKCDSAFMLCIPNVKISELSSLTDIHCLYSMGEHLTFTYKPANAAILIENQDCFFHWQRTLRHFDFASDSPNLDIYFSAGKQVLNSKFAELWPQYNEVYCVFDYDLEGLKIYQSLVTHNTNIFHYLVPKAYDLNWFKLVPKRMQDLSEAIRLADSLCLPSLADYFRRSKRFMEQEALLL